MPFVKLVKNKAYFKRFQVKYRRRREGKTDYKARRTLVVQDKNKYQSPKYRLVVRFTCSQVICQVVYSEIEGDKILAAAYSTELPRYGIKHGLKNYAAAYATGLLVARRTLQKLGMDNLYKGNTEITGEVVKCEDTNDAGRTREHWVAEVADERKPFRAYLDVGIRATTTGNRVFGALKGAADGGLDIPHNEKRFPGYDRIQEKYDAEFHADRIIGGHVADFMDKLQEEDPEIFVKRFSQWTEGGEIDGSMVRDIYTGAHEAIRADPSPAAKKPYKADKAFAKTAKKTLEQRKADVEAKRTARIAQLQAQLGGAEEDEE